MPNDSDELVVAQTGHIFRAPVGSDIPADIVDPLSADWVDLGYTTPAGAEFTFGKNTKDLPAWQSRDPIRTLVLSEPKSIKCTFMQWNDDTFDLAVGGGEWTDTATGVEFEPAEVGFLNEVAFAVEFTDDDKNYRFIFKRALNKAPFSFSTLPDDSANLPIEMSVLAPADASKPYKVQTDDPSIVATGS